MAQNLVVRSLLYIAAFVMGASFWAQGMLDPDLGWHLIGGDWILSNWAFPDRDFISAFNEEWRDYHWLFQVAVSKIFSHFGLHGLQVLFGVFSGLLIVILLKLLEPQDKSWSGSLILLFLLCGVIVYLPGAALRPQLLSLCVLGISIWLLRRPESKYELIILYGLTALLANIHVYWIFNPLFYLIFRVVPARRAGAERLRSAAVGATALLAAGVVSPYGWKNYSLVLEYAAMPMAYHREIAELKSIFAFPSHPLIVYLIVGAAGAKEIFRGGAEDSSERAAALLGIILPALSVKFLGIFMLTTLPYAFGASLEALEKLAPHVLRSKAMSFASAAIILAAFLARASFSTASELYKDPGAALGRFYPTAACALLGRENAKAPSPMTVAVGFDDGGWCAWAARRMGGLNIRVTADGRTQDVDVEHFLLNQKLFRAKPGWTGTLKAWSPRAVVARKDDPLAVGMLDLPGWRLRFEDRNFTLFTPSSTI